MSKERLVTGIRATGNLHIGNYYGAMKGIIELQEKYHAYYFIADIHALTTHPNPKDLKKKVLEVAKDYLAVGLDPEKSIFYVQSSIAEEVAELHTYLSMVMPLGDLMRCPTFKEKAKKHPDNINYGLVGYPVLMAADILIHQGSLIPVGEDQLVHLEIARKIVRRFNQLYGEIFPEPQPVIENAVRIPSLTGKGKMSKSDETASYIGLEEDTLMIERKVKKAYSDPTRIYKHQPGHPTVEGCNVYHLHTFFTSESERKEIIAACQGATIGCVQCKKSLSESIDVLLQPIREKREQISEDYLHDVLLYGKRKAKESAQEVISEVRKAIGLRMI